MVMARMMLLPKESGCRNANKGGAFCKIVVHSGVWRMFVGESNLLRGHVHKSGLSGNTNVGRFDCTWFGILFSRVRRSGLNWKSFCRNGSG